MKYKYTQPEEMKRLEERAKFKLSTGTKYPSMPHLLNKVIAVPKSPEVRKIVIDLDKKNV